MGWIYYHTHRTPKEECDDILNRGDNLVLKSSMVGSTYYAAVHNQRTGDIWAAVFLTKRDKGEFGYKDMDETCGPVEAKCPVGILDLLTPPANNYAAEWRHRCREYHARPKLKPGQIIEFEHPIVFTDGTTLSRFQVTTYQTRSRNRTCFRSLENGGLYRIPRISEKKFKVL